VRAPEFVWGRRTYVMGIVNCTPDSFSGDGCGGDVRAAVERGLRLAAEGADILDVGGESTRPGAAPVPPEVELERVVPVIAGLRRACDLPLSVDTVKAEVAEAALEAGACIVNDVWGLRRDRRIAEVAARHGAALIVVHNRPARPLVDGLGGMYPEVPYRDLLGEVAAELLESVRWAEEAGVAPERIWWDPGLGFGKTPAQNLELLRRLGELRLRLGPGRPLVVGPSRKSFIGRVLGLPVDQREEGTGACVALCVAAGTDVVRVHAVGAMARVARMADAVCRGWDGTR
jgi:dihydropteroate synthase